MRPLLLIFLLQITQRPLAQHIVSDNRFVSDAFNLAVNTVDINTRRGILAAGGDYGGEWTRDISINSWNGASLLRPNVAEKSLWSVTLNKDTIGHQYWDKIIWTIAAYNHYLITGNMAFLKQAYNCAGNTMKELEQNQLDKAVGLFMGPSVFNDGIAGYPEPVYDPTNHSSSVLDHKNSYSIKCLSTNCVYYGAYMALHKMGLILKAPQATSNKYLQQAGTLKQSILTAFYKSSNNTFSYLINNLGKTDNSQEALGISFAVLFGIIDGVNANELLSNAVVSAHGITSITPNFARYTDAMPGRHNNIVWPFINGFYANAALLTKDYKSFNKEFFNLTHLALDEDKGNYNFREIYNATTGKPDGGYQDWGDDRLNYHWESCKYQTWSATGYISMVINGLLGIKFQDNSFTLTPYLPEGIKMLQLDKLVYRNASYNVTVSGTGSTIQSFLLDGKRHPDNTLPAMLKGNHTITIVVK